MTEENRTPSHFAPEYDENGVPVDATTPVDLPVISAETNARRERRSMRTAQRKSDRVSRKSSRQRRRGLRDWTGAVLILLILGAIAGTLAWFMLYRDVTVTVDGRPVQVKVRSSIEEVAAAAGVQTQPGDLYSINGNLIEGVAGAPYTVTVDGYTLTRNRQAAYLVHGGEVMEFGKGPDTTEESTVEVRECLPKLEYPSYSGSISYVAQWGTMGTQEFEVGTVSGETKPGAIVEAPTNTVIKTLDPHPENTRQLVALTFDDGPGPYTPKFLALLAQYNVPATFFLLGDQVVENPVWTSQVIGSGAQVLSHTYSHQYLPDLSDEAFTSEIANGLDTLSSVGVTGTTAIRAPYGEFGAQGWLRSGGMVSVHVSWSVDSADWANIEKPTASAATVQPEQLTREEGETDEEFALRQQAENQRAAEESERAAADVDQQYAELICAGIHSGDIILLHDGGGDRSFELSILPIVIEQLRSEGYEFVTVSELLDADPNIPDDIASCTATMPEGSVWPQELA